MKVFEIQNAWHEAHDQGENQISGDDVFAFFFAACGEQSPRGYVEIPIECILAIAIGNAPDRNWNEVPASTREGDEEAAARWILALVPRGELRSAAEVGREDFYEDIVAE